MENDMNNMQALVDGMNANHQRERAKTQMTLGKMIKVLEAMPGTAEVKGIGELDSYRGYYIDLAFEPEQGVKKASVLLAACRAAMGKVFEGYKGGEFVMGELTPLWLAGYGECGQKILGISEDGKILTADDDQGH